MSSLRAKLGVPVPPTPWQAPQRLLPWILTQRFCSKASTSADAGGGPVYTFWAACCEVLGLAVVGAPPEQADSSAAARTVNPPMLAIRRVLMIRMRLVRMVAGLTTLSLLAHAVDGALCECRLQVVVARDEVRGDLADLGAVGGIARRPQTHGLKRLLHLTGRKLLTALQLLAETLRAVARAWERGAPAEQ